MKTVAKHRILSGWGPRHETPHAIAGRAAAMIESWSQLPGGLRGTWGFGGGKSLSLDDLDPLAASIAATVDENDHSSENRRSEAEGWTQVLFSPTFDNNAAYTDSAYVSLVAGATDPVWKDDPNKLKVVFKGEMTAFATDAGMIGLCRMLITTWEPDWLSFTSSTLVRADIATWGRDALSPRPGYVTWLSPAVVDTIPDGLPAQVTEFAGGWLISVLPMDDADQRALTVWGELHDHAGLRTQAKHAAANPTYVYC